MANGTTDDTEAKRLASLAHHHYSMILFVDVKPISTTYENEKSELQSLVCCIQLTIVSR